MSFCFLLREYKFKMNEISHNALCCVINNVLVVQKVALFFCVNHGSLNKKISSKQTSFVLVIAFLFLCFLFF